MIERRNWIQRHLIRRELERRELQPESEIEKSRDDPLLPVKSYYYQMYTEAVGQPGVLPESSPVHSSVANHISGMVDLAVARAENSYNTCRNATRGFPSYLQGEVDQYLNHITSALSRGTEGILEAAVGWLAEDDQLSYSRLGRIVRRIRPSSGAKALSNAQISAKEEIDDISRRFLDETRRKYRF